MTAQFSEILIYEGEELSLCNEPLENFVENNKMDIHFVFTSTACWRGYIGTWAIEGDRLYLKSLDANINTPDGPKKMGLEALFPDYPDGVFAHWYSGELRCPQGELLQYVHGGFGSIYERDLFFKVKKGVVLDSREVINGVAEKRKPKIVHSSDDQLQNGV